MRDAKKQLKGDHRYEEKPGSGKVCSSDRPKRGRPGCEDKEDDGRCSAAAADKVCKLRPANSYLTHRLSGWSPGSKKKRRTGSVELIRRGRTPRELMSSREWWALDDAAWPAGTGV